jgi:hypothetical protein
MRGPGALTFGDTWWVDGLQLVPGPDGLCDVPADKVAIAETIGFRRVAWYPQAGR